MTGGTRDGLRRHLKSFEHRGYTVVPSALSSDEVSALRHAIGEDRATHPDLWQQKAGRTPEGRAFAFQGHHYQSSKVLLTTTAFDRTCFHPAILPLVRQILGDDAVLEEHSVMVREPIAEAPLDAAASGVFEERYHRDGGGKIYKHKRFAIFMCQVIFFLDDVNATTHQSSIVPETVEEKRRLSVRDGGPAAKGVPVIDETVDELRLEIAAGKRTGVALTATAGDAAIINSASLHAALVRQTRKQRRTIHVYFGRATQPNMSEHTIVPPRLQTYDEALFRRPNKLTSLMRANFGPARL